MSDRALYPQSLRQALEMRAQAQAVPYAGGTDLMVRGQRWLGLPPLMPGPVLFIGHLAELRRVDQRNGELVLGACCDLASLLAQPRLPDPLRQALGAMAAPGVRNLATLGGNICNASPAGDTLPYLYAIDARVVLQGLQGKRELALAQFILGPGKTALASDELLVEVIIPQADFQRACYQKVAARKANALSKVSFVGLASLAEDGRPLDIRLALGAVAPRVVRSRSLEKTLAETWHGPSGGGPWPPPAVMEAYEQLIQPIDDQRSSAAYRKQVAGNLLRDFLQGLAPGVA